MFNKVLIANRGEIAVRIAQALHEMRIGAVAVYSDIDRTSRHVFAAGEAYALPGASASETYLNQEAILRIALECRADGLCFRRARVEQRYATAIQPSHDVSEQLRRWLTRIAANREEVERIADHVCVIHRGSLVMDASLDELRESWRRVDLVLPGHVHAGDFEMQGVERVRTRGQQVSVVARGNVDAVVARARDAGASTIDVTPLRLREIFLQTIDLETDGDN